MCDHPNPTPFVSSQLNPVLNEPLLVSPARAEVALSAPQDGLHELTPTPPKNPGGPPRGRVFRRAPVEEPLKSSPPSDLSPARSNTASSKEPERNDPIMAFFTSYLDERDKQVVQKSEPPKLPAAAPANQRKTRNKPVGKIRTDAVPEEEAKKRLQKLRVTPMSDSPQINDNQSIRIQDRMPEHVMTLVLDLDNTLIHAVEVPPPYESDFVIKVNHEGAIHTFYVSVRPYVGELLEYLRGRRDIEVIVFTAAKEVYGRAIVQKLDPEGTVIHHFLSEEHTTRTMGKKIKDLEKLGRPIETICIVEDNPDSYAYQKRSSFPLTRWSGNMNDDTELRDLVELLESARETGDLIGELDKFKATQVTNEAFQLIVGETE